MNWTLVIGVTAALLSGLVLGILTTLWWVDDD